MYQIAKRKPASWQQVNKYQGRTSKSKGYYGRITIKYVKALTEKHLTLIPCLGQMSYIQPPKLLLFFCNLNKMSHLHYIFSSGFSRIFVHSIESYVDLYNRT